MNITNPLLPTRAGEYILQDQGYGIDLKDDYAYIAVYQWGLAIINISNPANRFPPRSILNTSAQAQDVFVSGHYAYIADAAYGLQIINVSNKRFPNLAGGYQTNYAYQLYHSGVFVSGDYAYLANQTQGLMIFDITGDTDKDGLSNWWENIYPCIDANVQDDLLDSDIDSLSNKVEFFTRTDPCSADSDGGGEEDGFEIAAGRDPLDPLDDDSDGDGLPNYWEYSYICMNANTADNLADPDLDYLNNEDEFTHSTDPCDLDTDNDRFTDGKEVLVGTDPLDPNLHPEESPYPPSRRHGQGGGGDSGGGCTEMAGASGSGFLSLLPAVMLLFLRIQRRSFPRR